MHVRVLARWGHCLVTTPLTSSAVSPLLPPTTRLLEPERKISTPLCALVRGVGRALLPTRTGDLAIAIVTLFNPFEIQSCVFLSTTTYTTHPVIS
jgi:hypothetical protein